MTHPPPIDIELRVPGDHLMLALLGERDGYLKAVEAAFPEARIVARGDELKISGADADVKSVNTVFEELLVLVRQGQDLDMERVREVIHLVRADVENPSGVFTDGVAVGRGKVIRPKTLNQKEYVDAIRANTVVFAIGPAGTGKTYLAVAKAVEWLDKGEIDRIVLSRPAVEAGESLGFLPGDLQEKVDPYLRPLYDALEDMMPSDRVRKALEDRTIEIAPLAYMRGRTLSDAFVILDEAQNSTKAQMKMFLTRLGLNSQVVITGDKTQIDLPRKEDSGLLQVEAILRGVDGIEFIYLDETDVLRHRLVKDIIRAYARSDSEGGS